MRSNILKLIAVLAICFLIGAALVSCGNKAEPEAGATGATGATGNGIATIRLSDDGLKYIVTYTNGNVEEVDVPTAPCPNNCENVTTFEYVNHKRVYNAETEAYEFVEGKYLDVCNDCGRSQIVTEVRHSMTSAGIVQPTCTEEGFEGAVCTVCAHAEKVEGTEIPALEHSTAVYTPVLEADKNICEQGGYIICVCDNLNRDGSVCGEVFTKKVEPLGHTVETWIKTSNTPTLLAGASNAIEGICVTCGETLTLDLEALNDEDYAYAVTTAPTCTLEGTGTFTYTVAAEFVLAEGLVEENVTVKTVGEWKFDYATVVPATNHFINGVSILDYEKVGGYYVYGQDGIYALDGHTPKCGETCEGFYECSVCEVPYLIQVIGPHVGTVTETAPTCTAGNKFTCDECDQTWDGEEAALGHDLVPTLLANETFTAFTFVYDCSRCEHTEGSMDVTADVGAPEIIEFCNKNGTATYKYEYETDKFATVVKTLPSNLEKHTLKVDGETVLPTDGYYNYVKYAAYITVLNNTDMTPCGATGEGVATCGECGVPFGIAIKTFHEFKLDTEDSRYVASTCTTYGTDVFVCTRTGCTESYTETSTQLAPHNYEYDAYQSGDKWYISAECACGATEDGVHGVEGQVSSEITTDPTCVAEGVETITITAVIGGEPKTFTRTKAVAKVPHKLGGVDITTLWNDAQGAYDYNTNFVVLNTAEIVCESGSLYAGYYQCDECAIKYSVDLYITHLWDNGTQTKAPTCTANGETTYKCTICTTGTKVVADIPATGHGAQYLTAKVTTAPTQLNTGILTIHCADCGADLTVTLPALNTGLYTKTVVSTADCYNKGQNKYTIDGFETVYGNFDVEVLETVNETAHSDYIPGVTATTTFVEIELRDIYGYEDVECEVTYTVYMCEHCGTYIKVAEDVRPLNLQ